MSIRRSHYELAFEGYLGRRGIPFVAMDDVRHVGRFQSGAKRFDYIVYPADGRACLVDVKGRKSTGPGAVRECRIKNWVTRADVTGLISWQEAFGQSFSAHFVFGFWLADVDELVVPAALREDVFTFAGRTYSFWLAPVVEYAQYAKLFSQRWDTLVVPAEAFRRISQRLDDCWIGAPC